MQCKSSTDLSWEYVGTFGTCSRLKSLREKCGRNGKKTFAYALIKGSDVRECGSFLKTLPGFRRGLSLDWGCGVWNFERGLPPETELLTKPCG